MSDEQSFKGRVTRQGEEAIGKLAQELLESPVVSSALSAAFETRERAVRAQEVAMGALNLPSGSDLERLTRRVRSVSQRLEGIEDGLDRLDGRLAAPSAGSEFEERLSRIEAALERLESSLARSTPSRSAPAGSNARKSAAGSGARKPSGGSGAGKSTGSKATAGSRSTAGSKSTGSKSNAGSGSRKPTGRTGARRPRSTG